MNIEIRQPELEALILQRMASGRFETVEDVLIAALRSSSDAEDVIPAETSNSSKSFVELFEPVRGLFADGELDFSRNLSNSRTVDLS